MFDALTWINLIDKVKGWFKAEPKPYSEEERAALKRLIIELSNLRFLLSYYVEGNLYQATDFSFREVGNENSINEIKSLFDKPIKFNDSFPVKTIKEMFKEPFFPADIKRKFPFLKDELTIEPDKLLT